MSVKGTSDTLFVSKTQLTIITAFANKKVVKYETLKRIDYMYSTATEIGFINFIDYDNKGIRFEFAKSANEKISKTVDLLKGTVDDLIVNETVVEELKFYQRNLFTIIISFILGFPLGLIGISLMWYYKKSHAAGRMLVTFMAFLLWGTCGYLSYQNYKSAMIEANTALNEYSNVLNNAYSSMEESVNGIAKQDIINESETTKAKEIETFSVGDVYESKEVKIMYINSGDYSVDNEYMQPESGNKYIFAEFSIENVGATDYSTGSVLFDCYADDTECKQSIIPAEGILTTITSLPPGKNTKGKIFFEVPNNASSIELEYKINSLTGDKVKFTFK